MMNLPALINDDFRFNLYYFQQFLFPGFSFVIED